jgi:hypothetical protein
MACGGQSVIDALQSRVRALADDARARWEATKPVPNLPLLTVSELMKALKDGRIKPSGEIKERRRKPVWERDE